MMNCSLRSIRIQCITGWFFACLFVDKAWSVNAAPSGWDEAIHQELTDDVHRGDVVHRRRRKEWMPVARPNVASLKVFVDAGHGGRDDGARGHRGTIEKDLCLDLALRVKGELIRAARLGDFAIDVQLSRDEDRTLSLTDRVKAANGWGADLFVSLHANSSEFPRARGFEVYFLNAEASDAEAFRVARLENQGSRTQPLKRDILWMLTDVQRQVHVQESSSFAESVFLSLSRRFRSNGRGVRQAPFTVLSGTQMPALLVEVGYLTNWEDSENLLKPAYRKRLASAISAGVVEFALRKRKIS